MCCSADVESINSLMNFNRSDHSCLDFTLNLYTLAINHIICLRTASLKWNIFKF